MLMENKTKMSDKRFDIKKDDDSLVLKTSSFLLCYGKDNCPSTRHKK